MSGLLFVAMVVSAPCVGPFTADSQRIGPYEIGQPVASLKDRYTSVRREIVADDGGEHPQYRVELCPGIMVIADADEADRKVVSLSTTSAAFLTLQGAYVGLRVETLRSLYPKGRLYYSDVEGRHTTFLTGSGLAFAVAFNGIAERCFAEAKGCDHLFNNRRTIALGVIAARP